MEAHLHKIAVQQGYEINVNNGVYVQGKAYSHAKRLEVASALLVAQKETGGARPNISSVARQCKVSRAFVRKIELEVQDQGTVILPRMLLPNGKKRDKKESGPGARTLDALDTFVILILYIKEPSRALPSYVAHLHHFTGTVVSKSVLCRFFKEAYPFTASLHRPNLIPLDKFRPENSARAFEYLRIIAKVDPCRLKFGDEKCLKGREVFNRRVRRHPMTGEIPPMGTTPDFTNTYSLTGFCGIDRRATPVFCKLHEDANDASEFSESVELACAAGFFNNGDVLVLDNAAIHYGGENSVLEEWLWDHCGVFLLFLPPRSPELNPIELVWNTMVQRLKRVPLQELYLIGAHSSAIASMQILNGITHREVESFYHKAGI